MIGGVAFISDWIGAQGSYHYVTNHQSRVKMRRGEARAFYGFVCVPSAVFGLQPKSHTPIANNIIPPIRNQKLASQRNQPSPTHTHTHRSSNAHAHQAFAAVTLLNHHNQIYPKLYH